MAKQAEPGQVVLAIAGRDKGKLFMISEVLDDQYVMIVNGKSRPLANPKKKKLKHLVLQSAKLDAIASKIEQSSQVFDAEIRKGLENSIKK